MSLTLLEDLMMRILRCGEIPQHLAIIMDGNRRYGQLYKLASERDAYMGGWKTADYVSKLSHALGIKKVTFYVFSIENFKRSKKELKMLLDDMMPQALNKLLENVDEIRRRRDCVRVIGKKSMLPTHLQDLIEKLERGTSGYEPNHTLNLAIAYTAQEEIFQAVRRVVQMPLGQTGGTPDRLIEESVRNELYLPDDVDCLVRTSGEVRFSDFLLWQLDRAYVNIQNSMWPQFGLGGFMRVILGFQKSRRYMCKMSEK